MGSKLLSAFKVSAPMVTKASLPTCTGIHSAQRMFGCEINEDGSSRSFWQFGFDGHDHLSLDVETLSWVSAEPVAIKTKRWWEMERCYAEYDKAYLEGLCLTSLHRYLELGGQSLTRKGKTSSGQCKAKNDPSTPNSAEPPCPLAAREA